MANTLFKGFKLVNTGYTSFENDYLYFVRSNSGATDGYIQLNGKKYGTAKDVENELKALIGTLPSGFDTVVNYIDAAATSAETAAKNYASSAITSAITALDAEVSGASNGITVTVKEVDGKISEVAVESPDFNNLYDAKGAADSAETAAKSYADGIVATETSARTAADEALGARIDALTGSSHSHSNKDVLDGISAEKVAAWDAAEQNAKDYADSAITEVIGSASESANTLGKLETTILDNEEVTASALTALNDALTTETSARTAADEALGARIDALTGSSHSHSNKDVLDGISAEKVAAWDAAEQNAKDYADSAITSAITALDAVVTGSSSAVTVTVTEVDGKLTSATAEVHVSAVANNALEVKGDGLFAAIYYEDLDV